jgi:hypothetical protein
VNCAVAFAPEGYGPEAKSIIADLLDLGRQLSAWCGREGALDAHRGYAETRTCRFSLPLLATQRRPILHPSPLSRMPLDQVKWPQGGGSRGSAVSATHLVLLSVCQGPVQVTHDTVGVNAQTV